MLDPMAYFESDCDSYYINSISNVICEKASLQEAGKKIILFIADIIDWIWRMIKKIIKWFKSLFKKDPKSTEQILVELGVAAQSDIDAGNIVIPKSDDSSVTPMQPKDVDFALNPMMVAFKNDQTISITFREVTKSLKTDGSDGKIRGQSGGRSGNVENFFRGMSILGKGRPLIAMYYIKNINDSQDHLLAHCKILNKGSTDKSSLSQLDSYMEKVYKDAQEFFKNNRKGCDVQMSELEGFSRTLGQCSQLLRAYDESSSTASKEYYQSASKISNLMAQLQYGLNDITKCLKGVYLIAPTYCNTIRDISMLSEFTEKMINAGIPSKYIGFNIYMASHGDLKGDGSPLNPTWGHSRVVFFPIKNKDVVYKIAINGVGIRSNRIESSSWATISTSKYSDMFAAVRSVTKNRCVIEMERLDTHEKGMVHKAALTPDLRQKIKNICEELKMQNDISVDIHAENIGFKDGHACIIDYGNAEALAS